MKRFLAFIIAAVMMLSFASCGSKNTDDGKKAANQDEEVILTGETSVLVVYFSWSGHLQTMARWIAEREAVLILP